MDFCCPTNNIKALKIKIGYNIVTPTTPSVGDCWVELSRVTVVGANWLLLIYM